MATAATRARRGGGQGRAALRARLEARREEIETAALTRVRAIADPAEVADPAYADGLRVAVSAAIDYGIETTGREGSDPPLPIALLAQARMAARVGIPLDTVLRRYFAGYSLLGYFILEEAGNAGITDGAELQRLLGAHAGIFDRLVAAVGEEYGREAEARRVGSERRQVERVERLLAGEMVDSAPLDYELDAHHVAIVASGPHAEAAIRELAAGLDRRLLLLCPSEGSAWAWLGGRHSFESAAAKRLLGSLATSAPRGAFATGEPGRGHEGWRLSHRQALAALAVAERGPEPAVRYRDVALTAAVIRDELLATSLRRLYIEPLRAAPDGGRVALATLHAYFEADRNVSSAAATLSVSRRTVFNRLQAIEAIIGCRLASVAANLELAVHLDVLNDLPPIPT